MSMQKYLFSMAFMVVAVIAVIAVGPESDTYAANKPNHMIIVQRNITKELFQTGSLKFPGNFPGNMLQIVMDYYTPSERHIIKVIETVDLNKDGNGAKVSVLKGGTGYSNVTLSFTSQRGHGIDFLINIWGELKVIP